MLEILESGLPAGNATYLNTSPKGEPQLGKRGLYRPIGGGSFAEGPLLWVLNLSDGEHDLVAIAERSGLTFDRDPCGSGLAGGAGLLAEETAFRQRMSAGDRRLEGRLV